MYLSNFLLISLNSLSILFFDFFFSSLSLLALSMSLVFFEICSFKFSIKVSNFAIFDWIWAEKSLIFCILLLDFANSFWCKRNCSLYFSSSDSILLRFFFASSALTRAVSVFVSSSYSEASGIHSSLSSS